MKRILLLLLCFQNLAFSQNKKGQNEISLPLHPWIAITQSLYVDYEHFKSPKKSSTFRVGYQGDNMLVSWFSNISTKGIRADFGQRWYLKGETSKVFRFYVGVNATLEHTTINLKDNGFNFPKDSIQTKGFSFAPEVNAGLKIVILKSFTISPSLGLRYYFNNINTDNLIKNPTYWTSNNWDPEKPIWQEKRNAVELQNFRKGILPVPYLHFGWIF